MKILLIHPKGTGYMGQISRSGISGIARLSFTTIAALTPPEHQVDFHDARISQPDFDGNWDVVGFSAMTAEVLDAYRMADEFRKRGKIVVIGGYHATGMPEEAAEHADAVIVGEAELLWPRILHEIEHGGLTQKIYKNDQFIEMKNMAIPRRDLLDPKKYTIHGTIQTSRGCPFGCDFCSVTKFFGQSYRQRPVEEVIEELKLMNNKRLMFVDDNLVGNRRYAKELFRAMIPMKLEWGAQTSITITQDDELIDLYARAGGKYCFIGFESISPNILKSVSKGWNSPEKYFTGVRALHKRGIAVMGSFIFGLDGDDIGVFRRTVEFINKAKIDIPYFNIMTPLPGTDLFQQMKTDGRIFDFNWNNYDVAHVVFQPSGMTPEQLQSGWHWANRETWKLSSIMYRILRLDRGLVWRSIAAYMYWRKAMKYCSLVPDPQTFSDANIG